MSGEPIEALLEADFNALADRLEKDRFAEHVLFRLGARRRARIGVVAFAGGLGAAFAASQFTDVVSLVAPALAQSAPDLAAAGLMSQLLTTLLFAGALTATALVLRRES
jgi:hypothetical protein